MKKRVKTNTTFLLRLYLCNGFPSVIPRTRAVSSSGWRDTPKRKKRKSPYSAARSHHTFKLQRPNCHNRLTAGGRCRDTTTNGHRHMCKSLEPRKDLTTTTHHSALRLTMHHVVAVRLGYLSRLHPLWTTHTDGAGIGAQGRRVPKNAPQTHAQR